MIRYFTIVLATCLCLLLAPWASAQDSRLTYQGSLEDAGQPAQGNHDFRFTLFDNQGNTVGSTNTRNGVPVVGGVFSVELNFGSTAFDGGQRLLEIAVRRAGEVDFTTLSPRTPVIPAPYAQLANKALTADQALSAQALASTGPVATITISDQFVARFGPIDAQGNTRVRLGHPNNSAFGAGSTVGGGGTTQGGNPNAAMGDFSTVAGGATNRATGERSVVSGGTSNNASGAESSVGGGTFNNAIESRSTVSGGSSNRAEGSSSAVGGGSTNHALGFVSTIGGGLRNCAGGAYSWAGGNYAVVRPAVAPAWTFSRCKDLDSYPGGDGDEGTFVWADRSSGNNRFISTGSNQFLVRAAGGMGVGTNAPAAQLHVNGAASGDALLVQSNGVNRARFASNGTTIGPGTVRASLTVRGPDTPAFGPEIHLVGSSPDQVNSGRIRFIEGTAQNNNRGAFIQYDGSARLLHLGVHDTSDNNPVFDVNAITIRRGNAQVGIGRAPTNNALEVAGNASKTTSGSWLANSDARIKTDVQSIDGALERLMALQPVTFRYTEKYLDRHPTITDQRYYNVLAQAFAQIFPEAVKGSGQYLDSHPHCEEAPDGPDCAAAEILQVDIHPALVTAIAAIQEQQAVIQSQARRLDELEARLSALETRLD